MVACRILVVAVTLLGCSSALQLFRRPSSNRASLEVGIGPGGRPVVLTKRQSPERLDHDDDNFVFIGGQGHSNPIISSGGGFDDSIHSNPIISSHSSGGFLDSIHHSVDPLPADVGFHPQEAQPSLDFHHNDQPNFQHHQPSPPAPRKNNFQQQRQQASFSQGGGRNQAKGSRAFGALFSGRDEFVPRRQQAGFHEKRRQESTPQGFDRHQQSTSGFRQQESTSQGFDRHQQSSTSSGFHQQTSRRSSNDRFSHDSGRHDDRFGPVSQPRSIKIPGLPIRLVVSRVTRRH